MWNSCKIVIPVGKPILLGIIINRFKFKIWLHTKIPERKVKLWQKEFAIFTNSYQNMMPKNMASLQGRWLPKSYETIKKVQDIFKRNPSITIVAAAKKLGISPSTLCRFKVKKQKGNCTKVCKGSREPWKNCLQENMRRIVGKSCGYRRWNIRHTKPFGNTW